MRDKRKNIEQNYYEHLIMSLSHRNNWNSMQKNNTKINKKNKGTVTAVEKDGMNGIDGSAETVAVK